jgi:ubiquitin C-terminal hydrolase
MKSEAKIKTFPELLEFCKLDETTNKPCYYALVKTGKKRGVYNIHSIVNESYDKYHLKELLGNIITYRIPICPEYDIFPNHYKLGKLTTHKETYDEYLTFFYNLYKHLSTLSVDEYDGLDNHEGLHLTPFDIMITNVTKNDLIDEKKRWSFTFDKKTINKKFMEYFVYVHRNRIFNDINLDYIYGYNYTAIRITQKILSDDDYYEIIGLKGTSNKNISIDSNELKVKKEKLENCVKEVLKKYNNEIQKREAKEAFKKLNIIYETLCNDKNREKYDSEKKNILNNSVLISSNSSDYSTKILDRIEKENKGYEIDFGKIRGLSINETEDELKHSKGPNKESDKNNKYPKNKKRYPIKKDARKKLNKIKNKNKYRKNPQRKGINKDENKEIKVEKEEKIKIISSVIDVNSDDNVEIINVKSFDENDFREIKTISPGIKKNTKCKRSLSDDLLDDNSNLKNTILNAKREKRKYLQIFKRKNIFINKGIISLENKGNTCYINSIIQLLLNTPILRDFLLNAGNFMFDLQSPCELVDEFIQINNYCWKEKQKIAYDISVFLENLFKYTNYTEFKQDDAADFLGYLIDTFHEKLNKIKNPPKIEIINEINDYRNLLDIDNLKQQSFIKNTFYVKVLNTIKCKNCHKIKYNLQCENMIAVEVTGSKLKQCLDNYLKEEKLTDYECDCGAKKGISKKLDIIEIGDVIFFNLKRFKSNGTKINSYIDFPNYLLMDEYIIPSEKNKYKRKLYQLYSIVNHWGDNIGSNNEINQGHYTTFSFNFQKNSWIGYSDDKVVHLFTDEVKSNFSYILAYIHVKYDIKKNNAIINIDVNKLKNVISCDNKIVNFPVPIFSKKIEKESHPLNIPLTPFYSKKSGTDFEKINEGFPGVFSKKNESLFSDKEKPLFPEKQNQLKRNNSGETSKSNKKENFNIDIEPIKNSIDISGSDRKEETENNKKTNIIKKNKNQMSIEDALSVLSKRCEELDITPSNVFKDFNDKKLELRRHKNNSKLIKRRKEFMKTVKNIMKIKKEDIGKGNSDDDDEIIELDESQTDKIIIGDITIQVPRSKNEYVNILEVHKDMIFKLEGKEIKLVNDSEFQKSGKNIKKYYFLPKSIDFYRDIDTKITKKVYLEQIRTLCIICGKIILYDSLFSHTLDFHYFFFNQKCLYFYDFKAMFTRYFKRKMIDHIESLRNTSNQIRFCLNLSKRFGYETDVNYEEYAAKITEINSKTIPKKYEHNFTENQIKEKRDKNKGKANIFANVKYEKEIKEKKYDDFRSKKIFASNDANNSHK